jgi:predicted amino acid-binding ACT domain protein
MRTVNSFLAALAIACSMVACSQTDSGVTTKVKAKFAQDDLVKAHEINVTTRDGVVTLTGEVDTPQARAQAVRLARETDGVSNVVDELRVDVAATGGEVDDLDIDVDVDRDVERGVRKAGEAIRKGAEETADAAKRTGKAIGDAVTDDDRDSDRDGK